MWEYRLIKYNVLRAVGYYEGKVVTEDVIVLNNLEKAPHFDSFYDNEERDTNANQRKSTQIKNKTNFSDCKTLESEICDNLRNLRSSDSLINGESNYNYIYRINCGGDTYTDEFGQHWMKDDSSFSSSWAADFKDLNPYLASQRVTYDPIRGTRDWSLFGHFRFGRHKLKYNFPLPNGKYRVELYFTEPWYGTGGSASTDCEGLRIFDVAVNDSVVLNDLDIWAESGHDGTLKKVVYVNVKDGKLEISFPEVKAGQALISAIAIASEEKIVVPMNLRANLWSWAKAENDVLEKTPKEMLPEDKNARVSTIYEAEKASIKGKTKKLLIKNKEGIRFEKSAVNSIQWNISMGLAQVYVLRFNYMNSTGKQQKVNLKLISENGTILKNDEITLPETLEKWKTISTTTGNYINAGSYKVILSGENLNGLSFESLEVQ